MTDCPNPAPRCVDCGAGDVPIDSDGLCQACFTVRGIRGMAEMLQHGAPSEPHREAVTGQRLAAIIAAATAQMAESERLMLWFECHQLFGGKLDEETCPELVSVVQSLHEPVARKTLASRWN